MDQVTRCRQCEITPVAMQGWVCRYCLYSEQWDRAARWIDLSDTRPSYRLLVRFLRAWNTVLVMGSHGFGSDGAPTLPSPWDDPGKTRE
jgi:hypothetical protein